MPKNVNIINTSKSGGTPDGPIQADLAALKEEKAGQARLATGRNAQAGRGDSELLGWLWMDTAELWIRKKRIAQVGASSENGPRAAILTHVVDPGAMEAIRRVEGWRRFRQVKHQLLAARF